MVQVRGRSLRYDRYVIAPGSDARDLALFSALPSLAHHLHLSNPMKTMILCQVCQREICLTRRGTLFKHGVTHGTGAAICKGSGQPHRPVSHVESGLSADMVWTLRCAAERGVTCGRVNHSKVTIDALVSRGFLELNGTRSQLLTFGRPFRSVPSYAITEAGRTMLASIATPSEES
jgi:hypothetical protein